MVTGFLGRMGTTVANMVNENEQFELVALVNDKLDENRQSVQKWEAIAPVFGTIEEAIAKIHPDVVVDFTSPDVAYYNTKYYIEHEVHPVIGTTGFTDEQLKELKQLSTTKKLGGLIAPNFAIGSVLMQVFSAEAAKYFPDVEIIEMHHDQKLDAPSGTAIKTAELIYEQRGERQQGHPEEKEVLEGARGADYHGIPIHAVRLPGLNSHQIVQFGGPGEGLTIRQDSYDRQSYMKGVAIGIEAVMTEHTLIYGLENLLWK